MIEESVHILAVREGEAYVSAQRQSSCGHCSARSGCGTSVLSRYIGRRSMEMWVDDPVGVKVNDKAVIQLQEVGLFKASVLFYLFPLIVFLLFALLGEYISKAIGMNSELLIIVFSVFGLGLSYLLLHKGEQKIIHDNRLRPVIIKRAEPLSVIPISVQSNH